jgi:hypothetical protein
MELILEHTNLKHTFTISRESIDIQLFDSGIRSDGFSGYEATSNPYYKTTVPVMIDDLNKIRSIIESTTDVTPEVFWAKIHPLFERRHVKLCFRYGLFICMIKKLYELWEYDDKTDNRLHYRNPSIEKTF